MQSETWTSESILNERPPKRILAIRLDNIGDVVMLGPALRSLRRTFPNSHITLMASPAGSQVIPLLPWVDEALTWRAIWQDVSGTMPFDPQRELDLAGRLRASRYEAAFIFTSFSQSPFPPAYVCYLAGIPFRAGQSKEFGGGLLNQGGKPPPDSGHQVDRNLALLEKTGIPVADRSLELEIPVEVRVETRRILQQAGVDSGQPYIVLAPGASCAARRYDPQRYAYVAHLLAQRTALPLVIVGSPREAETLAPILHETGAGQIFSLVGLTNVPQLADVIRRSALVIANNSASLHLADAFRRPMVILYSGTEYITQWEPRHSPSRLLRREVSCSPCYHFQCPYAMECLDIPPEEVVEAALELLQAGAPVTADRFGFRLNHSHRSSA